MEDLIERLNDLYGVERLDCAPGISDPEAVQLAIAELRRLAKEVEVLKEELRCADLDYRDIYRELQRVWSEY